VSIASELGRVAGVATFEKRGFRMVKLLELILSRARAAAKAAKAARPIHAGSTKSYISSLPAGNKWVKLLNPAPKPTNVAPFDFPPTLPSVGVNRWKGGPKLTAPSVTAPIDASRRRMRDKVKWISRATGNLQGPYRGPWDV
jgi:hypothetical protein